MKQSVAFACNDCRRGDRKYDGGSWEESTERPVIRASGFREMARRRAPCRVESPRGRLGNRAAIATNVRGLQPSSVQAFSLSLSLFVSSILAIPQARVQAHFLETIFLPFSLFSQPSAFPTPGGASACFTETFASTNVVPICHPLFLN